MKSVLNSHWKAWCWSSNTLATWWEQSTHWKRPWCWERLKAGREGDDRWDRWGRDGWMASWVWASSGKPGVLQSMGSQRVGRDWSELNLSSALLCLWLCLSGVSFLWNNMVFVLLCLAYFNALFICSPVDGHLGLFPPSAVAAVNMGVQGSVWGPAFTLGGFTQKSEIAGSYGHSVFNFWGTLKPSSVAAAPFYTLPQQHTRVPVSPHPGQRWLGLTLFGPHQPGRCEVAPHCDFDLRFPGG